MKMRFPLIPAFRSAFAILLLPASLIAQESQSLLWKVTSPGNSKASYLFGTIHLLPENKFLFTDKMQQAFEATETLALEMDIDIPMGEQLKMAQQMMMPDGKTWAEFMTAEEFALLRSAYVDSMGIKANKFDKQYVKIKPLYLSGLVLTTLLGNVKAYEQELSAMAKKSKKPLIGLETLEQQMSFMASVSMEEQIKQVKEAGASLLREYNRMLDAYLSQDLSALESVARESGELEGMEEVLLTKRNEAWIPLIREQAAKSSTFFAVGALHLVGEKGVIEGLRGAGFTVEAVN
ncbi:MAG: TraB/GumN family protein [Flavobacteriales bacterium]|nr:TraB/GumN family protein [Flavobacteriales bacterium]